MHTAFYKVIVAVSFVLAAASFSSGYELKTRYVTVIYEKEDQLRQFNKGISLGSLSYLAKSQKNLKTEDEIRNKLDVIVEKVETILEMYPGELNFRVLLLTNEAEVQKIYKKKFGSKVDYIAFYTPGDKTVYLSLDDLRIGVLAHEFAHVVIDQYFGISPPAKIHEVLSHFVEIHIKD